jgi:hypothetical protein
MRATFVCRPAPSGVQRVGGGSRAEMASSAADSASSIAACTKSMASSTQASAMSAFIAASSAASWCVFLFDACSDPGDMVLPLAANVLPVRRRLTLGGTCLVLELIGRCAGVSRALAASMSSCSAAPWLGALSLSVTIVLCRRSSRTVRSDRFPPLRLLSRAGLGSPTVSMVGAAEPPVIIRRDTIFDRRLVAAITLLRALCGA